MPQPTAAKPVSQVKNPVKEPVFIPFASKIRPTMDRKVRQFCEDNGFLLRDVLEVSLLEYMEAFEAAQKSDAAGDSEDEDAETSPYDHTGEEVDEIPE